jgi:dipeptidyl-peptidase-4
MDGQDGRRQDQVKRRDKTTIGVLKSMAETPSFTARVEITKVGQRAYRCALIRPRNFVQGRKYPVIVYAYAGPGLQMVKVAPGNYLLQQWIADHGFVVVVIDGRGTPGRGRNWERVIKGNLIKVPLADQVNALQSLGKNYPELDLDRVGVYGWSFGGYFSAMAVMQRPDVYRAGVAGAPVADWEDYDTHYTERFLGLPHDNPKGYKDSNVLTHAPKLTRPLLLIHGTMDDNVYFSHSIKISDTLFRAGKKHDFLPLSGFTHGFSEPLVTRRLYTRIVDFFTKHL